MRLRNIRGSRDVIATSEFVIHNETTLKGKWSEVFGNNNPIYMEIGMGKGQFIMELARQNPEINYIGIEKYSSVLIRAIEKRQEVEISNLLLIRMDAEYITDVFEQNEITGIYLNFSDPWPKERHIKRRLTSKHFFEKYDKILVREGQVVFKTDNRELFDFSLEEIEAADWNLLSHTFDLHHSEYVQGNIMTEYEEKFVTDGKAIHYLSAYHNNNK